MGLLLQINFHFKNSGKFKISSDAEVCDRQRETGSKFIHREDNRRDNKQKEQQSEKYTDRTLLLQAFSHFKTTNKQL
jgi:hypothetical protein